MSLQIYNSLTKNKQPFQPLVPGKISMYVCGITVYDYCHLGHARTFVCFDVIVRYLRSQGFEVNYVRNITDIDDKIIARAAENNEPVEVLTQRFIDALAEDEKALGMVPPNVEPRATDNVANIIALIERLFETGHAYQIPNGDVYYDVRKFAEYGKLAHKDLAGQEAGARIDVVTDKRNAEDFVLWKTAKPGEPMWESPWGQGRPGWHIECSAMSMDCLGDTFDIHGGGFDLQFPHHENEIAQSQAASGKTFANVWMHVGFLQVNKEKMSKSLGNFFTIRDVLKSYDAETVRYFLLSSQYRSQLNYSTDNLEQAQHGLRRLYQTLREVNPSTAPEQSEYRDRFQQAMNDDFNTPDALAVMYELSHEINRLRESDQENAAAHAALLKELGGILGVLDQAPSQFLQGDVEDASQIEALIQARDAAREAKDWLKADEIREQLHNMGIVLEDRAGKTIWRRN